MTGAEREDELDAYLRRALPLHRQISEAERIEPPQELDRAVLRQARQAIRSSPGMRVFRAPRWALPVGLAATVLLAVAAGTSFLLRTNAPRPVVAARQATPPMDSFSVAEALDAPAAKQRLDADPAAPASTGTANSSMRMANSPRLSAPAATLSAMDAATADPAAWLQRIEKLRTEGKTADADRELKRFRATYPDYPLRASRAQPAAPASNGASGAGAAPAAAAGSSSAEDNRTSAPHP